MKIKKMTDGQCMEIFQKLIASRVKLGTAYVSDPDTGVLTHQLLLITCGEISVQSSPEPLMYPLMPVVSPETTIH